MSKFLQQIVKRGLVQKSMDYGTGLATMRRMSAALPATGRPQNDKGTAAVPKTIETPSIAIPSSMRPNEDWFLAQIRKQEEVRKQEVEEMENEDDPKTMILLSWREENNKVVVDVTPAKSPTASVKINQPSTKEPRCFLISLKRPPRERRWE